VPAEYAEIPAWVGTVHTVEGFRRLGVATRLLETTEDHLTDQGARQVALWAASENMPARLLYERQGYVLVGEFSRVGEDCVLMVKDLREEEGLSAAQTASPKRASTGRAIVTDAAERVGLHVIRALGRAGIEVVATEISDRAAICPGFSSCYTQQSELLPLWERPAEDWVERLLQIGHEGDVLVPACYNSLARAVRHWQHLAPVYRAVLPSWEALQTANDKWSLYQFAADVEVRTPETWRPQDEAELEALAEQIDYPVILKFRNDDGIFLRPSERYLRADSASTLREAWRLFHDRQAHPIIQQYISGDGYGFEALYDNDGTAVAAFQHRRIVECPPEGGPSALSESVRLDELEQLGRRLLDGLGWQGVAMVEFRRCSRTGDLYLLEINPRFWGSLPLSEAAGVSFPELYYRCARGEAVRAEDYQTGLRSRLLPTYIISSALSMGRGNGGFMRGCRQIANLLDPRVHEGLMSLDDPRGSVAYLRRSLREI
jgi:predicted ATP-grasp superfamily ATP-dependent carboligase